jgi:hypothetical protein
MDHSTHTFGADGSLLASHRLEAEAYCQYLSAAARGVARDELLILGLTRELSLLQRESDNQATVTVPASGRRSIPSPVIRRWLAMLGLLARA